MFCTDDAGICNAIAFWFELQLDMEGQLVISTSPHQPSSQQQPTWKQVRVTAGAHCWQCEAALVSAVHGLWHSHLLVQRASMLLMLCGS
jgi:hypothetical protein